MKSRFLVLFLICSFLANASDAHKIELIYPGIYKISVGKIDTFTPFSVCDSKPLAEVLNSFRSKKEFLQPEQIKISRTRRGCAVEIPLNEEEQLYGFGLQIGSFMQKGLKKKPIVNDNPLNNLGYSHAPQPFYVSNKGYGVIVNTSRYTTFYCGTLQKTGNKEQNEEGKEIATTTEALYSNKQSENNVQVDVPGADGLEIFLICGDNLKEVIEKYNLLGGGGAIPPVWGLGVKYRMKGDSNAENVMKMADYFRKKEIPCDVLGLEPGWQTKAYSCSYVWEKSRFPNPELLINDLKKNSFHVNLWEHAYVNPSSPIHDSLARFSGDYLVWNGLVPDFLTKEGRDIFRNYHKMTLVEKGISGFKLDECDNSNISQGDANWGFPELSQFPSGVDGEQMHQLFGSMYIRTMNSIYKEMNQRTYLDYRSGNLFLSSVPATLYSDIYGHRDYIQMISNSGFAGLLWSPELRESQSDVELIQRLQTLLMSSQVVLNCWYLQNPPWLQFDKDKNNRNEFLSNASEMENTVRTLLNVRMSLIPYLYTAFANYHFSGIPPFRALVVDYPDDQKVFGIDDQFMLGNDLMAAPFYEGAVQRKVYFPEGTWFDFNSGKKYEGAQSYTIPYTSSQLPLFVKDHSIIPYAVPVQFVNDLTSFNIECRIYGDGVANTSLYTDDGKSYDFEKGMYNWMSLSWNGKKGSVSDKGIFKKKLYKINSWKVIKENIVGM